MKISRFEFPSNAELESRISVMCSIKQGKLPIQFEWLKNGIQLEKNDRISIVTGEDGSMLTFRQLRAEDAANYTCIAKNREGMDALTTRLKMNCK